MSLSVASPLARSLAVGLLFVAAGGLTEAARLRGLQQRERWPQEADALYMPSSSVLRLLSLGHVELAADLVAARTYVYFGTQMIARQAQPWLERYLNTVVDLDPTYRPIYERGAVMLVYNGQAFSADSVLKATALVRRGLATYPDAFGLWYQLGFNLVFELPKLAGRDDPRLPAWRREGIEALRRATLSPDVPGWYANLVAKMMTEQGEREMAIRHLQRVYAITSDPYSRQQIAYKLEALMGQAASSSTRALENDRRQFEDQIAHGYPYAPESFSLIAGPRPLPPRSDVRDHKAEQTSRTEPTR